MTYTVENVRVASGDTIALHHWADRGVASPRAVVHVLHGMAEHGARYDRLANALIGEGFEVFADDHLGHGATARSEADLGHLADSDGWHKVLAASWECVKFARGARGSVPLILLGHSMGSFMALDLMAEHGGDLSGVALSGSNGPPPAIARIGRWVAGFERLRQGPRGRSTILTKMSFGDLNKQFSPARTKFDWLSRDESAVDAYIADPRCGFAFSNESWVVFLDGLLAYWKERRPARTRSSLPVYVLSGARDPVGGNGKGVLALVEALRSAGLSDVEMKLYPDARHEVFNETNYEQVVRDLIIWLSRVADTGSRADPMRA